MFNVNRGKLVRILLFALVLGGLFLAARASGLTEQLSIAGMRGLLAEAGVVGIVLFLLAYAGSNLVSLPAIVFILAALVSYGGVLGVGLAFGGGLLAASTSFFAVRLLKGKQSEPAEAKKALSTKVACLLAPLDRRPVRTVALLRVFLMLSGPLNMALAASKIRFRAYITGTAIGMVPPLCFYALTLDCWIPR